ncbi:hypothetical protein QDA04_gp85 [Microbacterium phage Megan]|uniref:Uncharacterized protein n=1 Tax=Microbacterium phage Megan TaxID=2656551 RepID=A0A649VKU7_9CAUD|nr:hypothetical protein QDA04_gp85 [Microbacterium phage Megan]QGJ92755.1 hypothetical protein PBI_MEGAN_85 [Microbacterium phage Megan]
MAERLFTWVIYEKPADYPTQYVVRPWVTDGEVIASFAARAFDTLEDARAAIPPGLMLSPLPEPDPAILEVWL